MNFRAFSKIISMVLLRVKLHNVLNVLVGQELHTIPEHLSSPLVFRSLLILLYFFFWPLWCLFFFDIRILITPMVSSNSSLISTFY